MRTAKLPTRRNGPSHERAIGVVLLALMASCSSPKREPMTPTELRRAIASGARTIELQIGSLQYELVRIPAGEFQMGSTADDPDRQPNEMPARRVRISQPFYLGRYQVTQAQYTALAGANPSNFQGADLAMDQVTYPLAVAFCEKVSTLNGVKVTFPTEAQWEYACRAHTNTRYYSGAAAPDLGRVAWFAGNSGDRVHPGGKKEGNGFGLYDMLGNVWEFCSDFLPDYERIADTDPIGRPTDRPAMRGGGWMSDAKYCRCATRLLSDTMFGGTGLRLAVNP